MVCHTKNAKNHLISGICFLLAGLVFFGLGLASKDAEQTAKFVAATLFIISAIRQFRIYRKRIQTHLQ